MAQLLTKSSHQKICKLELLIKACCWAYSVHLPLCEDNCHDTPLLIFGGHHCLPLGAKYAVSIKLLVQVLMLSQSIPQSAFSHPCSTQQIGLYSKQCLCCTAGMLMSAKTYLKFVKLQTCRLHVSRQVISMRSWRCPACFLMQRRCTTSCFAKNQRTYFCTVTAAS